MTEFDPALGIDLPAIDQVAFVVEDLDRALERHVAILGIEPWNVYETEPEDFESCTYYGEPTTPAWRVATATVGDLMVELIEPVSGRSIHRDHLDEHGEGLHHLGVFSWDESTVYDVVEAFDTPAVGVMQQGNFQGTEFWYFDTRALLNGLILETAIRADVDARTGGRVYPPEG